MVSRVSRGRPKGSLGKQTKKLGITVPKDLDNDFEELATLTGVKKATLITNLLIDIHPHVKKSIEYSKLIRDHNMSLDDARKYFFNLLADFFEDVAGVVKDHEDDYSKHAQAQAIEQVKDERSED